MGPLQGLQRAQKVNPERLTSLKQLCHQEAQRNVALLEGQVMDVLKMGNNRIYGGQGEGSTGEETPRR